MAPRLDSEQQKILNVLLSEAQRIRDPRARRVFERAAVQTGLVESGLRNLNYGDADSQGWRQERASLYPNPTNVRASARRFRQEFLQHYDPGEKSYDVAWQVQRPREDLRGRYREEAAKAAQILAAYGRGGGGAPAPAGGEGPVTLPGAPAGMDFGPAQNIAALIELSQQQRPRAQGSSLQAPAFAARPVMGGAVPMGGGGPAARADISALIEAAATQGRSAPTPGVPARVIPGDLPASGGSPRGSGRVVPLGGSRNAGKGAFEVSGPNPARLQKPLTSFLGKVANVYGGKLVGLDGSTHSKYTVNGNVSAHYTGNATDVFTIDGKPATGARLIRAGRAALIAAGMPRKQALKAPGGLYNVNGYQIIFGVSGAENGGDHTDHLHVGRRPR